MGATYIVSPSSDIQESDFVSLQEACAQVQPGDEIVLLDGQYPGRNVCETRSGTQDKPIMIRAQNEGKAVLSAALSVTEWIKKEKNLWLSHPLSDLDMRGITLWKKNDEAPHQILKEGKPSKPGQFLFNPETRQFLLFSKRNPNKSQWKAWDASATALRVQGVGHYMIDGLIFEYNHIGLLIGCSRCGDPTENIHVKNSTSQYATHWAMAATSGPGERTRHVTFDNVTLRYVAGSGAGHRTQNEYCFKFAANVQNTGGEFGTITNSDIHHCNMHGIQASNGWDNITLTRNTCHDASLKKSGAAACMRCGTTRGCTISGNTIYGGDNPQGTGIYLQDGAHEIVVEDNEISGFDWHGIYIFSTNGKGVYHTVIKDNDIKDNRITGIRIEAASAKDGGILIANNSFRGNNTGMYLIPKRQDKVEGVRLLNNMCDSRPSRCLKLGDGVDVEMLEKNDEGAEK